MLEVINEPRAESRSFLLLMLVRRAALWLLRSVSIPRVLRPRSPSEGGHQPCCTRETMEATSAASAAGSSAVSPSRWLDSSLVPFRLMRFFGSCLRVQGKGSGLRV